MLVPRAVARAQRLLQLRRQGRYSWVATKPLANVSVGSYHTIPVVAFFSFDIRLNLILIPEDPKYYAAHYGEPPQRAINDSSQSLQRLHMYYTSN